jgi:hypothetical protein
MFKHDHFSHDYVPPTSDLPGTILPAIPKTLGVAGVIVAESAALRARVMLSY